MGHALWVICHVLMGCEKQVSCRAFALCAAVRALRRRHNRAFNGRGKGSELSEMDRSIESSECNELSKSSARASKSESNCNGKRAFGSNGGHASKGVSSCGCERASDSERELASECDCESDARNACTCDRDDGATVGQPADASCCCAPSAQDASCCCGSSTDAAASYSCADDPYRGSLRSVTVDFLFLDLSCCDRCQGADQRVAQAVERCRGVLRACGYDISLNLIHVDSEEKARAHRFASSPTVRVNGVDICPSIEENDCACCSDMSDAAVACRIFPFNGTYYEVPPTDMLVRGIMEVVLQNRRPLDPPSPFFLPENLQRFYQGVAKKAK